MVAGQPGRGAGFALQAAALGLGSVLLVQAVLVTSLLFALPINAGRPSAGDPVGVAVGGAARRVGRGDRDRRQPDRGPFARILETWTAVVAVLGPALVLCVLGARVVKGPASAVLLGVVSGALWGLFAVLTKGVVDRLDDGLWALLRTPSCTCGRWCASRAPPISRRRSGLGR